MKLGAPSESRTAFPAVIHAMIWPFEQDAVYDAPETAGVYALWRYGEVIFYGHASGGESTIRSCLAEHLAGLRGAPTRRATHCSWETSANPEGRERELLSRFWATFNRLPSCNAKPRDLPRPGDH